MKRFYVLEDFTGVRIYLGDIEVSSKLFGNEVSGNIFEPDNSFMTPSVLKKYLPVSYEITP